MNPRRVWDEEVQLFCWLALGHSHWALVRTSFYEDRRLYIEAMASFQLVVKPTAGGDKFSVDASPAMTIADLKEKVESKSQISPAEQRLIYKGQVLKDERTVDSYGERALRFCRSRS